MLSEPILGALLKILNGNGSTYMDVIQKTPDVHFGGAVWDAVFNIYRTVSLPIAVGMMVIYFLIRLTQTQIELGSNMNMEAMLKPMMGFVLGLAILFGTGSGQQGNNAQVVVSIIELGQGMTNELMTNIGAGGPSGDSENYHEIMEEHLVIINDMTKPDFAKIDRPGTPNAEIVIDKGYKMLGGIGVAFSLLIPWLAAAVGGFYAMVIVYGRLFEIYVRIAIAPIALSDMFVRGADSTGFRFLKEFTALMIQGFLILLVFHIFSLIQVNSFGQGLGGVAAYTSMFIAQLALLGRTSSLAKGLVGVH